jgi:hypothetical protein
MIVRILGEGQFDVAGEHLDTATGMLPEAVPAGRELLDPAVVGPPIVCLASEQAAGLHDERIIAVDFDRWLRDRNGRP